MKHLWKHLMCTALCLCLLFSAALAETVDINLHVMTDYTDADAWILTSNFLRSRLIIAIMLLSS